MRAVRVSAYGGPDVLQVQEIPQPTAGAGQVVLKVLAGGINPLDAWFRSGHLAARFARPLPYTPGTDAVGSVAELGEGVDTFELGDIVMGVLPVLSDGAYAEYTVIDVERLIHVPQGLDPILAASAMTPALTGVQMVERAQTLGSCYRILILGALGGVGRAAIAAALAGGIDITAAVLPSQEDETRALGVQQVVTADDAARPETLGGSFDVVLDLVGPDAVLPWERAIGPDGKVVSSVPLPPAAFQRQDVSTIPFAFSADARTLATVATMLRDGKLTVSQIEVLALDETAKAHAVLPGNAGGKKFVVDPAR